MCRLEYALTNNFIDGIAVKRKLKSLTDTFVMTNREAVFVTLGQVESQRLITDTGYRQIGQVLIAFCGFNIRRSKTLDRSAKAGALTRLAAAFISAAPRHLSATESHARDWQSAL